MLLVVLLALELCTHGKLIHAVCFRYDSLLKTNYVSIKNNFKQIYSRNTYIKKVCDAGDLPNFFTYVCVSLIVTEK